MFQAVCRVNTSKSQAGGTVPKDYLDAISRKVNLMMGNLFFSVGPQIRQLIPNPAYDFPTFVSFIESAYLQLISRVLPMSLEENACTSMKGEICIGEMQKGDLHGEGIKIFIPKAQSPSDKSFFIYSKKWDGNRSPEALVFSENSLSSIYIGAIENNSLNTEGELFTSTNSSKFWKQDHLSRHIFSPTLEMYEGGLIGKDIHTVLRQGQGCLESCTLINQAPESYYHYEGEFNQGKIHGFGELTDSTGSYRGYWFPMQLWSVSLSVLIENENGSIEGFIKGKTFLAPFTYEGEFFNGVIHGRGTLTDANNKKYVGNWSMIEVICEGKTEEALIGLSHSVLEDTKGETNGYIFFKNESNPVPFKFQDSQSRNPLMYYCEKIVTTSNQTSYEIYFSPNS